MIDLTPLITYLLPIVVLVLTGLIVWGAKKAVDYFTAKTGIALNAEARDLIDAAIKRGIKFAEAELNRQVSRLDPKVTVNHPLVVAAGNYAVQAVPDALIRAGVTPEMLANKILAELPATASPSEPLKVEVQQ
jgi:citrate lyase alpha subunit